MTSKPSTRERIRSEAAALFRQQGYCGSSMSGLAAQVGISKSSLYHHFTSKQAVLSEIIELTVDRVAPLVQAVADSDRPITERLRQAIEIHTVEAIRDQDAVACFVEEGRFLGPELRALHVAKRDRYELIFRLMLAEGIASGDFPNQDVDLTIKAILGMCNSVVRWYSPGGPQTPERIAAEFARFGVGAASGEHEHALLAGSP